AALRGPRGKASSGGRRSLASSSYPSAGFVLLGPESCRYRHSHSWRKPMPFNPLLDQEPDFSADDDVQHETYFRMILEFAEANQAAFQLAEVDLDVVRNAHDK